MEGFKPLANGDQIHGYSHASKIFVTDGFRRAPKYQFLFYVRIKLGIGLTQSGIFNRDQEVGALVKKFDLPKWSVDTKTLNSYNRPTIIQTKLKNDPLNITFHDDNDDAMRDFWFNYYTYYYRDSDHSDSLYNANTKYKTRQTRDWGYNPLKGNESNQHLINSIELFSFHNNRFTQYTLYNPIITSWKNGEHDHSQGTGTMESTMTLAYESVKYFKGWCTPDKFNDMMLYYDRTPSPIDASGGSTVRGVGKNGQLETANGTVTDMRSKGDSKQSGGLGGLKDGIMGAAGAFAIGGAVGLVKGIMGGSNPLSGVSVPSLGSLTNTIQGGLTNLTSGLSGPGGIGATVSGIGGKVSTALGDAGSSIQASATSAYESAKAALPSNWFG